MNVKDLLGKYQYGMRALGSIAGTYHTNTLEGYEHWKAAGIKFWETDVAISSDDRYVMIGHYLDEPTMRRMEIDDLPQELTYDWYMKQKLFPKSTKGLTPLSLEDMIASAKEETDAVYMLDMYPFSIEDSYNKTKHFLTYLDNCIGEDKSLYDRIIVEAYNKGMIDAIGEFPQIKYRQMSVSTFMTNENISDIHQVVKYAKENKISVISYEWRYAKKHIDHLEVLKDCGFVFISRSVTNVFGNAKKKKYGVNIALLDYYFRKPSDIFAMARLFISRIQQKHG